MTTLEKKCFDELDHFRGAPSIVDGEEGKWYRPHRFPVQVREDKKGLEGGGVVGGRDWPADEELAAFDEAKEKMYAAWNAFRAATGEPSLRGDEYPWTQERHEEAERRRAARNQPAAEREGTG